MGNFWRLSGVKSIMKYWGYFCVKVGAAAVALYYLWLGVLSLLPEPDRFHRLPRFPYDLPTTLAAGVFFLLCCGVLYLIVLDQRFRCRACLCWLRMPVETGSWSRMLQLGRPRIEYICPFGHGTLRVPEVHISGLEMHDWQAHEDMWKELESLEDSRR